jgi:hypothetical protein
VPIWVASSLIAPPPDRRAALARSSAVNFRYPGRAALNPRLTPHLAGNQATKLVMIASGEATMQRHDAPILASSAALALVVGVVVLAVGGGFAAELAAIVLLGLAGIAIVSLVFLLVGQSEERDREQHPRG